MKSIGVTKRRGGRAAAALLGALLLLMPVKTVQAQNMAAAVSIADRIGNEEMKAYGESLLNGADAVVEEGAAPSGKGTSYYVDANLGDDGNEGTSEENPWKSIEKVNEMTYQPGDRILLKAGSEWTDVTLQPKGMGTKENPVIISCYGAGVMPKLTGNGKVPELIYLENQSYIDISYLNISNTVEGFTGIYNKKGSDDGRKVGDFRGIRVAGNPGTEEMSVKGIRIHHVYVHDVSGECRWVGGKEDSADAQTGTYKGGGWDLSKRTGGILFEILQPDSGDKPVIFENITVEDNVLNNNSFGGIIFKQWYGEKTGTNENWANRERGNHWTPHKNITVQNNYLNHKNSGFACDTIYLTSIDGAVVQNNVSVGAGTCGIELCYTDDVTIQYNEIIDTMTKAGGADSAGIDPDRCATNALIQYNYVHGTGDGILLCGFTMGSAVVRYNVIQDAEKRYVNIHGDTGANYIYQNTFLNTEDRKNVTFINTSGGTKYTTGTDNLHYIYNNIFYNAASVDSVVLAEGTSWFYDSNSYYGAAVKAPASDKNAVLADPEFTDGSKEGLTSMKTDLKKLDHIKLCYHSPLIGKGRKIVRADDRAENRYLMWSLEDENDSIIEKKDFFGDPIRNYKGIGAADYQLKDGYGILHGYVKDSYGYLIEGVTVTAGEMQTVTNEKGYFSLEPLAEGEYKVSVTADNYQPGEEKKITVTGNSVAEEKLTLGMSTITTGSITGTVKNIGGGSLARASVVVTDGKNSYEGSTDSNGVYCIENLPVKEGYSVTVKKSDYREQTVTEQTVRPGYKMTVDFALIRDNRTEAYVIDENFESYEVGEFCGNELWNVIAASGKGSVEVKQDEPGGNKYLCIDKARNSEISVYNKSALKLSGTVTVEMRIKRTWIGKNNQFSAYTYNADTWDEENPNGSKNPMATIALAKGNYITHNVTGKSTSVIAGQYETDRWDVVRNVVDLDNGTFDFYINDMKKPVLSEQPLRSIYDTLDYLNIFSSASHTGDLCVDDIKVCKGLPTDYNDTSLREVTINGTAAVQRANEYELSQTFSFETEKAEVAAECVNENAAVMINGEKYDGETPVSVDIPDVTNEVEIKVTAEDGVTVNDYKLIIKKEDINEIACLKSITSDTGELSPAYERDITEYGMTVPAGTKEITFDVEKFYEKSTIEVFVEDVMQQENLTVKLHDGENKIDIKSGSADGTNYITYHIAVIRLADSKNVPDKEKETDTEKEQETEKQPDTEKEQETEKQPDTEKEPGTEKQPDTEKEPGTEKQPDTEKEQETEKEPGTEKQPDTEKQDETKLRILKKGTIFKNAKTKEKYCVLKPGKLKSGKVVGAEVSYYRAYAKSKKVVINKTVKYKGITYKITEISDKALANQKKVVSVKMGDNIKKIGACAFSGCTKLSKVSIGKNVKTIGKKAFYKCTKLKKVIIPSNVKVISQYTFAKCTNLKTVTIKSKCLKTVGKQAFSGINKRAVIRVPQKKLKSYKKMLQKKTGWKKTMTIRAI